MELWPFQRKIADAITDNTVEKVTIVKPVRVGFTTILAGALGSYVKNDPTSVIVLLPRESDCRKFVVSDMDPIFHATPCLKGALNVTSDDENRSVLLERRYTGGSIKFIAAKSPANLRAHTAKVLYVDEADAMMPTVEGDPIELGIKRTITFPDRKIIIGCSPTELETSNVLNSYKESNQQVLEIKCVECGEYTEILWKHIKCHLDNDGSPIPSTAHFSCPHCGCEVDERHKAEMVENHRWRATMPEVTNHAGFRFNSLVSPLPNMSWKILYSEYLKVKKEPEKHKTFVNTILAQGWRSDGDRLDTESFNELIEDISLTNIPENVFLFTAGCDVQIDRIEVTILGHEDVGDGVETICSLGHFIIPGSPETNTVWEKLDRFLKSKWHHPIGAEIGIEATIIDAGNWTDKVHDFCYPRSGRQIYAGMGRSGKRLPVERSVSKKYKTPYYVVGVDTLKNWLYTRVEEKVGLRFSDELTEVQPDYFEQLTSEERVLKFVNGKQEYSFKRRNSVRAETLDCFVYGWAVRSCCYKSLDLYRQELEDQVNNNDDFSLSDFSKGLHS